LKSFIRSSERSASPEFLEPRALPEPSAHLEPLETSIHRAR